MKKSFTLLEIIFSIVILSIVVVSTLNIIQVLSTKNNTTYKTTIAKIDLEATRLFLENRLSVDKKLSHLRYENNSLYYTDDLLLKNITSYSKTIEGDIITIELCTNNSVEICTKFLLK